MLVKSLVYNVYKVDLPGSEQSHSCKMFASSSSVVTRVVNFFSCTFVFCLVQSLGCSSRTFRRYQMVAVQKHCGPFGVCSITQ